MKKVVVADWSCYFKWFIT